MGVGYVWARHGITFEELRFFAEFEFLAKFMFDVYIMSLPHAVFFLFNFFL